VPKLSTIISLNEQAALETANGPSGSNPYATMQDLQGLDGVDQVARDQAAAAQADVQALDLRVTTLEDLPAGGSWEPATSFALVANAATLDVSLHRNFVCSTLLTANTTLTLANGLDGHHGTIQLRHDATSTAFTLSFTVAGRTKLLDLNCAQTDPLSLPNTITEYHYYYSTVGGQACIRLYKVFLWVPA
jgi:hypothetical protein